MSKEKICRFKTNTNLSIVDPVEKKNSSKKVTNIFYVSLKWFKATGWLEYSTLSNSIVFWICQIQSCFEFVKTLYRRFFRVNCAQTLHEKPVWVLFFQLKIALHKNHCKWFSMQRKELLINFTKTSTSTELAQKKKLIELREKPKERFQ